MITHEHQGVRPQRDDTHALIIWAHQGVSIGETAAGVGDVGGCADDLAMDDSDASPQFDTSGYVRRVRRIADLSQRELSARTGVVQSRVSRIESGDDLTVQTFVDVLAVAGMRLAVVDAEGRAVEPMPTAVFVDRAGRRRPAHLDVRAVPDPLTMRMLFRGADPIPPGGVWHHVREHRDRLSRRTGSMRRPSSSRRSWPPRDARQRGRRGGQGWAAREARAAIG